MSMSTQPENPVSTQKPAEGPQPIFLITGIDIHGARIPWRSHGFFYTEESARGCIANSSRICGDPRKFEIARFAIAEPAAPTPAVASPWISVDERVPEDGSMKLVITVYTEDREWPRIELGHYVEKWFVEEGRRVTHWMPLPAFPIQQAAAITKENTMDAVHSDIKEVEFASGKTIETQNNSRWLHQLESARQQRADDYELNPDGVRDRLAQECGFVVEQEGDERILRWYYQAEQLMKRDVAIFCNWNGAEDVKADEQRVMALLAAKR